VVPEEQLSDASLVKPVQLYTEVDLKQSFALVLGQEAAGVSKELAAETDLTVHVPMAPSVESLNVAAAASVLLYEAARQRGFKMGGQSKR
jgi:TrmH family RNA methyltransferase